VTPLRSQSASAWKDPSPHTIRFISVDDSVPLEVLDWGGSARALVLLAGGGDNAHGFDGFAPKLTAHNHVYGITRRGFGASGYKEEIDVGQRLEKDVRAGLDRVKLDKPILVGHSLAGAELSWMANAHPNRIAGLVSLEAGYSCALDDGRGGAATVEMMNFPAPQPPPPDTADLVNFSALQKYNERVNGYQFPGSGASRGEANETRRKRCRLAQSRGRSEADEAGHGRLKYTKIPVPSLFIFANPHGLGAWVDSSPDASVRSSAKADTDALAILTEKQEKAVEQGLPTARFITFMVQIISCFCRMKPMS